MKVSRVLVSLLMATATCAWAQTESLTIAPGDNLHISVLESTDLDQHVRVTDNGEIPLILGGNVKVAGMTPAEAAVAIDKRLMEGNYLLNPHATVQVDHLFTKNVSVMGQVRIPGSFDVGTARSIIDILSLAGGLTDAADRKVTIQRGNSNELISYNFSNDAAVAMKNMPLVFPGDTVLVSKTKAVYVLGDVGHPGGFAASTNDSQISVLQAVAYAGGTPPTAVPSHARLIRKTENGYTEIHLPLSDMQKGKQPDMVLQADDIIYVPYSYIRNMAVNLDALVAAATTASIYRF